MATGPDWTSRSRSEAGLGARTGFSVGTAGAGPTTPRGSGITCFRCVDRDSGACDSRVVYGAECPSDYPYASEERCSAACTNPEPEGWWRCDRQKWSCTRCGATHTGCASKKDCEAACVPPHDSATGGDSGTIWGGFLGRCVSGACYCVDSRYCDWKEGDNIFDYPWRLACCACNLAIMAWVRLVMMPRYGIKPRDDILGGNAFMHCLGACRSAVICGDHCAQMFWNGREDPRTPEGLQDLANNSQGYNCEQNNKPCFKCCMDKWNRGQLNCRGKPCPPRIDRWGRTRTWDPGSGFGKTHDW